MSNAAADALARAREIAAKLSVGAKKFEKVYIPVKDYPEINFLGLLIGPKGATQKQMQDATGAKILIRGRGASKDGAPSTTNHPDDNDDLHVHIEGSEEAVEKALKEVRSILFNPEQAMRLKNEQLQRLAEINNGGGSDSHYGPGGSEYQIEMRVPNNMVGLIIGRGGENIARIQSTLQVNVQIAKENEMKPGETLRSIVIRGTKENVDEAKLRIEDIIERDLKKNSMQGGGGGGGGGGGRELDHAFVVKLPVPNDKVGIIIGRGGMTIKGIQDRTKSYVQVPPQPDENDPNVRTLSIGADTKEAVDAAQMEIFMTFQSQQQSAANAYNASANAMQMLVPDDRVGIIIGKGGASIKEIQNRHRVRIQIPPTADIGTNPPMRTINIAGPVEGQQTAKYEIEMIVATNSLVNPATGGGGGLRGPSGGGNSADPYAAYGAYGAAAAAYGSYYDPYSAAAAYSAYYGAAAAGYSATAGTPTAAGAAAAAAAGTADVSAADLAAYHTAYWQYAAYYGEAAARMYYGAYSPPQGTPPPEGITLPTEEQIAANTAAATGQAAATTATATTAADASAAAATTTKESAAAASYDPAAAAAAAADATGGQAATTAQTATADAASADPAAATAAWEAYQKQYKEWYEAYGKAAGADPNPPAMT